MKRRKKLQFRDNAEDILLFSTESGVIAVQSTIKKQIISMITERDIFFDEIVTRTEKAKSTISEHIKDLEQTGLITSCPDQHDYRRKILSLSAQAIGRLTNEDRGSAEAYEAVPTQNFPFTEGDIPSFYRYMFSTIRIEAMKTGINIDPILQKAGLRIGKNLLPLVRKKTLAGTIKQLSWFWMTYGLGTITLLDEKPITLEVQGCFECRDLPVTGHAACSFDTGVFSAIFSREGSGNPDVHEIECYSSGDNRCVFIIHEKPETKDIPL
jgi:predicted hydrocarbon binding protein